LQLDTYWCLEKGYAKFVGEQVAVTDNDDGERHKLWVTRAKGWLKVMRFDALVAMLMYLFLPFSPIFFSHFFLPFFLPFFLSFFSLFSFSLPSLPHYLISFYSLLHYKQIVMFQRYTVSTVSFYILGASVLYGQDSVPKGYHKICCYFCVG
jgi:hypothetical protein